MRDAGGRSRGFAFLTFEDPAAVNAVMVREHFLDGKVVRVVFSISHLGHKLCAQSLVNVLFLISAQFLLYTPLNPNHLALTDNRQHRGYASSLSTPLDRPETSHSSARAPSHSEDLRGRSAQLSFK